jgi:uncharacterized protein YggE
MTRLLLSAACACAVLASPASAQDRNVPPTPTVVTTGEGVVQAAPDRAFVGISAESRASNPREAQRRNVELMKPVQDKLRAAGIPADAIRTTQYDLQQEWDFVNNRRVSRGYVARNSVEVRVDTLDRLGEILEIAVAAGATSVGDIRFDLKDREKLEQQALKLAVANARARADAAAGGAGQSVARVLRIEEHGVSAPPPPMPMMRTMARDEAGGAVPIAAGTMELRAHVTLTAELK